MTWVKLDDGFPDHLKVDGLSDPAFRLYVTALCHCARHLTDGYVAADRAPRLVPRFKKGLADELVTAELWTVAEGGWMVHDYLDFNPPAEKVKKERAAAAERMRSRRRSGERDTERTQERSAERAAGVRRPRPVPSRPDRSSSSQGLQEAPLDAAKPDEELTHQAHLDQVLHEVSRRKLDAADSPPTQPEAWRRTVERNDRTRLAPQHRLLHGQHPDWPLERYADVLDPDTAERDWSIPTAEETERDILAPLRQLEGVPPRRDLVDAARARIAARERTTGDDQ